VIDYFKNELGLSETEARGKAASRDRWYGVIDGLHRHVSVKELIQEDYDSWKGFSWPVVVLKGGHSISVLRQLARHQNEKHSEEFYIETTFYDALSGLQMEVRTLTAASNGKRPTAKEVARHYEAQ